MSQEYFYAERNLWRITAAAFALLCSPLTASADYPTRPVRVIVPYSPGGSSDAVARILSQKLGETLGQQFVIDNRPGAAGSLGREIVAKATPDGYTLLIGDSPHTINVHVLRHVPYDPIKDFTPVGMVVSFGYALTTRQDLEHKDIKALLSFAKANPDKLTYASGGRGTGQHIALAVAANLAGTKMTHVPYRGAQAAYQDILGGRIDLFFDNVSTALPLIDDNRVNVLAVSTPKRHPRLPNVPTLREVGLDFEMETWFGIFAPAATPKPVLDKLRAAMATAAEKPDFASVFTKSGGIGMKQTAAETEAMVAREMTLWTKLLKDAAVTAE